MKCATLFASAISCALASASCAPTQQYYNLVASAPGEAYDGLQLKPNGRYWYLGVPANSSCGDVAPAVTIYNYTLTIYADGTSNQQYGRYPARIGFFLLQTSVRLFLF